MHRPLHLFGILGMGCFTLGFGIDLYLTVEWFLGLGIGHRPLLFLGMLLIILGIQFGSLGLLGEMIANDRRSRDADYLIKKHL